MPTIVRPYLLVVLALLVSLPLVSTTASAGGEGEWQFLKAEDGIHVWKLEIPGKDLPGFRGQTVIEGSIDDVMKTMLNWQEHTQWMYRCKESLLVKKLDDRNAIMYNRTEAPWPVSDRDVVLKSVISRSPDSKQLHLNFSSIETSLKPEIDGVVRMPHLVGFYKLWQIGPDKTKVLYQVEADIGGSIPKWLSALAAQDLPYRTLSKLRERVQGNK